MSSQRRGVAEALRSWHGEGRGCVLATVVFSSDSAPRGLGAQLAITDGDLWVGGLSGGCAETAVLVQARALLAGHGDDALRQAAQISMTKDSLGSVGPICGATLGVLIERADADLVAHLQELVQAAAEGGGALAERHYQRLTDGGLRRARVSVSRPAPGAAGHRDSIAVDVDGDDLVVREHVVPTLRLVVGGAGDVAVELIRLARQLGWRSCLVDPRSGFVAQTLALVEPDVVLRAWPEPALAELVPDERTACVAAAHDEKIDVPFLSAALQSPAVYVGSIGSRVVQFERRAQLLAAVGEEAVQRHRGPAGLNLGGSSAAEIAISIASEIIAAWNGRAGGPLTHTSESIRAR